MSEKTVIANKSHICDMCGESIEKGEKYWFGNERIAKVERVGDDARQTGIEYMKWYICERCK